MPEFFHGSDSQCGETFPLVWSNENRCMLCNSYLPVLCALRGLVHKGNVVVVKGGDNLQA